MAKAEVQIFYVDGAKYMSPLYTYEVQYLFTPIACP